MGPFFLCRYLLAGVQISNCFWKWYRVPKINTRWTPGWNLNAFDFCSMLIIHPRNGSMYQSFNNSCKWPPNRWGRGRLRARCRWRAGSCSSPRSRRCQSPGTARSTKEGNKEEYNRWCCTLSLLPLTFLDSMWTRFKPSSSKTLRALESPTMPWEKRKQ